MECLIFLIFILFSLAYIGWAPILLMYIFASGKIKTAMVGNRKVKK